MVSIRKYVFETNSSSTHSLTLVSKSTKNMYSLTDTGYLEAGFDDYFSEAAYGHMGREDLGVKWEITDRVDALKSALGL